MNTGTAWREFVLSIAEELRIDRAISWFARKIDRGVLRDH